MHDGVVRRPPGARGRRRRGPRRGKFHPLPRIGDDLTGVTCPTGLKAAAEATIPRTGKKSDGETVEIPVRVTKAGVKSVTWKFERRER